MKSKIIITLSILLLVALLSVVTFAEQPTQQYNKIYLSPFYRATLTASTNYTYTVNVNPPDKISSVINAMIEFNAQINGQTQTFSLWVNGEACNNPTYSVTTAFSTTGQVQLYFDCSNRITKAGTYDVTLRSAVNTGTMSGWLDLTYMSNPLGSVEVKGTEYYENDDGTLFLLLKDANGNYITNATCEVDIYYPNIGNTTHPEWINNGLLRYLEEGLYYYDFTTPALAGLYMTNAQCFYTTENNYYYKAGSASKPSRTVLSGTYTGDTFVLNDYGDWIYTQCASSGGTPKTCDSYYDWTVGTNITKLYAQYLGESSGSPTMIMYYWNFKNNSWMQMANTLAFKGTASSGVPSGVDEYTTNEITNLTAGIATNYTVRIRTYTSGGSTYNLFTNWLTLNAVKYGTTIQDLKGSGEIHVSSWTPTEDRFYKVTTCDGYIDGRCGLFTNTDPNYDLPEGEIEDYLNITAVNTKDVTINYNTPFSVDCSALYFVKRWNGTGWSDITNDISVYSKPADENCLIEIPLSMTSGMQYQFWIEMDNYMKWEVEMSHIIHQKIKDSIDKMCANRNFTYINPITDSSIMPSDNMTKFCYYAYDDFYFENSYYQDSLAVDNAGEYASYLQELRFYRNFIYNRYMYLSLENTTQLPNFVWDNKHRNLTYYPTTTAIWNGTVLNNVSVYPNITVPVYPNVTVLPNYTYVDNTSHWLNFTYVANGTIALYPNITVNNSNVASDVWNYSGNVTTSLLDQIVEKVWSYIARYTHGVII